MLTTAEEAGLKDRCSKGSQWQYSHFEIHGSQPASLVILLGLCECVACLTAVAEAGSEAGPDEGGHPKGWGGVHVCQPTGV